MVPCAPIVCFVFVSSAPPQSPPLQNEEGYFDPSPGVAFALAAWKEAPSTNASFGRAAKGVTLRNLLMSAVSKGNVSKAKKKVSGKSAAGAEEAAADKCPLTGFDVGAFDWSMPPALREVAATADAEGDRPPLPALRIWVRRLSPGTRFRRSVRQIRAEILAVMLLCCGERETRT